MNARTQLLLLLGFVALLALLAVSAWRLVADSKSPRVLDVADGQIVQIPAATNASPAPSDERAILAMVNDYRELHGLSRLVATPSLSIVARAHSREMYSEGYFGHVSPAGETFFGRLRARGIPYTAAAEILALAPDAPEAFQQFLDSPDHRDRLVDSQYCEVGIGAYRGPGGLIVTMVLAVDRPYGWPPSRGCPAPAA